MRACRRVAKRLRRRDHLRWRHSERSEEFLFPGARSLQPRGRPNDVPVNRKPAQEQTRQCDQRKFHFRNFAKIRSGP